MNWRDELAARAEENDELLAAAQERVARHESSEAKAWAEVRRLKVALRRVMVVLTDPHERTPKATAAEVVSDALGVPINELGWLATPPSSGEKT